LLAPEVSVWINDKQDKFVRTLFLQLLAFKIVLLFSSRKAI
jgi:hypothetical protein